jgi:hypothetical protein
MWLISRQWRACRGHLHPPFLIARIKGEKKKKSKQKDYLGI